MLYLKYQSAFSCRIYSSGKLIAAVVNGSIHPKRPLSDEERKAIEGSVVLSVYDSLSGYPAIQKLMADTFGIVQTWPIQRRRAA